MENVRAFVPECLREFKEIDWSKYTPAGGWSWQEKFHAETVPQIEKRLASIRSAVADKKFVRERSTEMIRALNKAREVIHAVSESGIYIEDADDSVYAWMDASPEMLDTITKGIAKDANRTDDIANLESEAEYIAAFRDYFTLDLEYDMLMWGLELVPIRNRTKIFRMAEKKYADVAKVKNIVENSKCAAAQLYRDHFSQPIRELAIGYAKVPLIIRTLRKSIERYGEGAWKTRDPLLAHQIRTDCVEKCAKSHCDWAA